MGIGGIGIIRLSGNQALSIATQLFPLKTIPKPRYLYYGTLTHPTTKDAVDDGCLLFFEQPHSYTGESVVEFHCHGNPLILNQVLGLCLELGARLAKPGEFTERAFLHGKLDLTKAESVGELIHANSQKAQAVALNHLHGKLYTHIHGIRESLLRILEQVEGSIDFPDEVEAIDHHAVAQTCTTLLDEVSKLLATQDFGKWISDGVSCVIVGQPNVGKSSFLNQLLGENRAIVSAKAGTTRDFIEARLSLGGLVFDVIDTAGIREKTSDYIEKLGMKKIKTLLKTAQVIFWMVDGSKPLSSADKAIYAQIKHHPTVYILQNKCDRPTRIQNLPQNRPVLPISAKTGAGMDHFKARLHHDFTQTLEKSDLNLICNARQTACLASVSQDLRHFLANLGSGLEDDVLALDLKQAVQKLGEITGHAFTEEILDGIFSRFCVGK